MELTPSAKQLLKAFYLASRRVRVSGVYSTDMPISALDSMCVCLEACLYATLTIILMTLCVQYCIRAILRY